MARKNETYGIVITYSGVKPDKEIRQIFAGFYIEQVRNRLIDSNLSDAQKKEVISRLVKYHSQSALETR